MHKSLVNAALVQQHDETARYGCESAPHYTGKKKDATPQFHVVALLGLDQYEAAGQDFRGFGDAVHRKNLEGLGTNNSAIS
jgi:hypothetical protein